KRCTRTRTRRSWRSPSAVARPSTSPGWPGRSSWARTAEAVPLRGPRAALSFLTVLPVAGRDAASAHLGRAWFPAVGLLLGGAAGGAFGLVAEATTPAVGAAAALGALALLTGALHLDGLADAADGLLG